MNNNQINVYIYIIPIYDIKEAHDFKIETKNKIKINSIN